MALIPEELFKRRRNHNNTPQSTLLIIANYLVVCIAIALFTSANHINVFFWVVLAFLAGYNYYTIRRNREEYNKVAIIAYIISLVVLFLLYFVFKGQS